MRKEFWLVLHTIDAWTLYSWFSVGGSEPPAAGQGDHRVWLASGYGHAGWWSGHWCGSSCCWGSWEGFWKSIWRRWSRCPERNGCRWTPRCVWCLTFFIYCTVLCIALVWKCTPQIDLKKQQLIFAVMHWNLNFYVKCCNLRFFCIIRVVMWHVHVDLC